MAGKTDELKDFGDVFRPVLVAEVVVRRSISGCLNALTAFNGCWVVEVCR
jgi:hypothetical protein